MHIYFISLGCDKNLVDSEIMLGIIKEEGYTITFDETEAEVIVVNTCGFISDATNEGIETILRLAQYKKTGICKAIVVTGCMAQRYREEIFNEFPEVDAVVGTGDFEEIGRVIKEASAGAKVELVTDNNKLQNDKNNLKRVMITPQHFAYLKIAEGCDNFCTYCTIPSIRGKYRSRRIDSLVEEANMLAGKGVKELILVAQDTAKYGVDLYGRSVLHELLQKLSAIEGIQWIRILYCYPEHITDEIIEEMAQNPKVCHYLDMPIQHAQDDVLKRMGRRSSEQKLRAVIKKLRTAMPDISIRTTLIVGFPGETEEEFTGLLKFVKEMKFDRLGVFTYSKEEGTPAYSMKGQVQKTIKEKRKNKIMSIQKDISAEKCKKLIGATLKVIVDGKLPSEEVYCGRSYQDSYEIDGMVFFKSDEELYTGDFVNVLVQESSDYDITGVVIYESCE